MEKTINIDEISKNLGKHYKDKDIFFLDKETNKVFNIKFIRVVKTKNKIINEISIIFEQTTKRYFDKVNETVPFRNNYHFIVTDKIITRILDNPCFKKELETIEYIRKKLQFIQNFNFKMDI